MNKDIQAFIADLKKKKRSGRTIENYQRYLQRLMAFTGVKSAENIDKKIVDLFLRELYEFTDRLGEPLSKKTINYHLIALRSFLLFLKDRGRKTLSPTSVELEEDEKKKKRDVKPIELSRMRAAADSRGVDIVAKRDRAVFEVLADTGMRVSELSELKRVDFDDASESVAVSRQGEGVNLELGKQALKALRAYDGSRTDKNMYLFVSYDKAAHSLGRAAGLHKPLTPRSIQRIIKRQSDEISTGKEITPASLRNAVIARMVSSGADVDTISKKMGFKNKRSAQATIKSLPR